jgi:hypothetical protein
MVELVKGYFENRSLQERILKLLGVRLESFGGSSSSAPGSSTGAARRPGRTSHPAVGRGFWQGFLAEITALKARAVEVEQRGRL